MEYNVAEILLLIFSTKSVVQIQNSTTGEVGQNITIGVVMIDHIATTRLVVKEKYDEQMLLE